VNKYDTASAFRTALEQRLLTTSKSTGTPLDRLRKEAAGERLLARLAAHMPVNSWALKGGLALVARLDSDARATKDIDTTWREDAEVLNELLDEATDADLGDYFRFSVRPPQPIEAEGPEGGLRYRVVAHLDEREFERLQLDVNIVPTDPRPIETVRLRSNFSFAEMSAPEIPVISLGQHLAEKLHAYCRSYGTQQNSRAKDLYDMLVIVEQLPIPSSEALVAACKETFALRSTEWPPTPNEPPSEWKTIWSGFVQEYAIRWTNLTDAYAALRGFWSPVLASNSAQQWDARNWRWT
jgi:predicted nucleotidyltransferase component of viral defense system